MGIVLETSGEFRFASFREYEHRQKSGEDQGGAEDEHVQLERMKHERSRRRSQEQRHTAETAPIESEEGATRPTAAAP